MLEKIQMVLFIFLQFLANILVKFSSSPYVWNFLIDKDTIPLISSMNSHLLHTFRCNCWDKQWPQDGSVICSLREDSRRKLSAPSLPLLWRWACSQTAKVKNFKLCAQLLSRKLENLTSTIEVFISA